MIWKILIGVLSGLLVTWLLLVAALLVARPRGACSRRRFGCCRTCCGCCDGWLRTAPFPARSGGGWGCCWSTWPFPST